MAEFRVWEDLFNNGDVTSGETLDEDSEYRWHAIRPAYDDDYEVLVTVVGKDIEPKLIQIIYRVL